VSNPIEPNTIYSHDSIISMRALANCDPHGTQFFVILDRLVTTLDRRFNYWRKVVNENVGMWWGCCFGYCCANKHELNQLWLERLGVARDVAKAIDYLHGRKIIYRYVWCGAVIMQYFSMEMKFNEIDEIEIGLITFFFLFPKHLTPSRFFFLWQGPET